MHKTLAAVFALTLAGLPALGASALGGLSSTGNVWTNDVALPSGVTIHSGDVIRTDSTGLAIISSGATGRLEVRPGSEAVLGSTDLELRSGVVGSQKLTVRVGGFEIAARDAGREDNWFVVAERGGERLVAAHRGDVIVKTPNAAPLVVPAGSFALAAIPAPRAEDSTPSADAGSSKPKPDAKGNAGRGATRAGTRGGLSVSKMSVMTKVAIAGGAAAATTTGLVAAGVFSDEAASPTN